MKAGQQPLTVVVAAGGAPWESGVLEEIGRSTFMHLQRRCLDVAELLALSGLCDVAVVSTELVGLDADTVLALQRDGVRVVGVGHPERGFHLGMTTAEPGRLEATLREPAERAEPLAMGGVLAVWGPHGAPGRSVLAASVAAAWAAADRQVMLVDADHRGGALAQMFAVLDDVSGLVAACRCANRGEVAAIAEQAVLLEPGLHLLSGVARDDMWEQVREGPFQLVVRTLAQASDAVVVDLGPGLGEQNRHVLSVADQVLVVGRADPVGLARLVRALHDVASVRSGVEDPPVVVVNQLRPTGGWSTRDVGDAVARLAGMRPDVFLPADFKTLDAAALRGTVPARVAAGSPFSAGVSTLLEHLSVAG